MTRLQWAGGARYSTPQVAVVMMAASKREEEAAVEELPLMVEVEAEGIDVWVLQAAVSSVLKCGMRFACG
ncbi:hypothetical protein QJS10_CPA05g02494 [Acorus calamus]|uniref:Uncharacterized protein n=1 Tax=Acorus calamus TaxID=4465 RepID=A0AAV9EYG7_ACOCL|nr:hypothetical protein QJS10_CPA05g02494 [Acorus calamus]